MRVFNRLKHCRNRSGPGAGALGPIAIVVLSALMALAPSAIAGTIVAVVKDAHGNLVPGAAVYVTPANGHVDVKPLASASVYQRDGEILPMLTVIPVGTYVTFPNQDRVKHHLYSFSPAKKFELPLYAGTPPPVLFDKPGLVSLGCNIHDWMIAYILVVDTPFYGMTGDDGSVELPGVPAGPCHVEVWHPRMRNGSVKQDAVCPASGEATANFQIELKAPYRLRRSPTSSSAGYR